MNPSDDKATGGMSTLDMMSMPSHVRQVIRILLRRPRVSYGELCQAVDELPAEKRLTREELDDAIRTLLAMNWMSQTEESGQVIYGVAVKKKEGSEVTRAGATEERRASSRPDAITGLWDAVETGAREAEDGAKAQREMRSLHDEAPPPPKKKKRRLFDWLRRKDD